MSHRSPAADSRRNIKPVVASFRSNIIRESSLDRRLAASARVVCWLVTARITASARESARVKAAQTRNLVLMDIALVAARLHGGRGIDYPTYPVGPVEIPIEIQCSNPPVVWSPGHKNSQAGDLPKPIVLRIKLVYQGETTPNQSGESSLTFPRATG